MRRFVPAASLLALAAALGADAAPPVPELSEQTFARWRDYIAPSEEECAWEEIPWRDSFAEGVRDGQILGKPVLLWAMNGHPQGCV